jgi:hypothetical protein
MEAWYDPLHCMNDPQAEGHMASHIRRRTFLAALGRRGSMAARGARAAVRAHARVGVLMPFAAGDPEAQARLAAFMQGLQEQGW